MKTRIEKQDTPRAHSRLAPLGFTLIELMVAVVILMIALIFTLQLVGQGTGKMFDMRIRSQVKECARLTMEYFSALPPDVVYGMSKGSPRTGTFATAAGDQNLAAYVVESYPVCRNLSMPSGVGSKVQLRYTFCPGCLSHTNPDFPDFTSCMYFYKLRLTFNSVQYGGQNKSIEYSAKYFTGQGGPCDTTINPNGCGPGGFPDQLNDCIM